MLLTTFTRNTSGRDLIVGDVHGHFTKLQQDLDTIGFDPDRDRLFSVGDLVDRGPESAQVLDWLQKPWFFAVRGNHEQMAIDYFDGFGDERIYAANGGGWNISSPRDRQCEIAEWFNGLPVAIEIETSRGLVGIVHADCPTQSWRTLRQRLLHGTGIMQDAFVQTCLWSRSRIGMMHGDGVDDIRAVVVGHTPVKHWTSLGNVIYIDTGAWIPEGRGGGRFTLLDAETLQPIPLPAPHLARS